MATLILIYHGTNDHGGGTANMHCLPARRFREHMQHLKQSGFTIAPWREMLSGPSDRSRPQIGLTFDDGCRSDLENARLLQSLGFQALFFIATEYLDQEGYLSREELPELLQLGMGVGAHSHHHVQLSLLSHTQVEQELVSSKAILEDILQVPVITVSFPGGAYDDKILDIGRRAGYEYFYTSDWGVNSSRQYGRRILRRTSVLNHFDLTQFDDLIRLKGYYARQAMFFLKEGIKKSFGEDGWDRVRKTVVSRRR